jgi:four helix bundle protein
MTPDELKKRTKSFALDVMRLCETLPNTRSANVLANQLLRSATSVGANYRAACRARSDAEFISKIGITLEEADESVYWLELIQEAGIKRDEHLTRVVNEGNELTAIFVASSNTARNRVVPEHRKRGDKPVSNLKSEI